MRTAASLALVLLVAASSHAAPQDAPAAAPAPAQPPHAPDAAATPDGQDLAAGKAGRRRRAAESIGSEGVLLVLSPAQVDGVPGTNRNTDFEYLSPLAGREAAIVAAAAAGGDGGAAVDRIYLPMRNPAMERWTGPEPGADAATASRSGFGEARVLDRLADDLAALLRTRSVLRVSAAPPRAVEPMLARLLESVRSKLADATIRIAEAPPGTKDDLFESLRKTLAAPPAGSAGSDGDRPAARRTVEIVTARTLLAEMREVKSPAEIDRIRRAVDATVAGHQDALRAARAGLFEYHLAAIVELRCRAGGCLRQAYPSIAGSGPWSCILHYDRNTRRLEEGDLVVLDAGGECDGYAADVTRTIPVSGRFTEEQAKVYDAVLDAQERAIAAVRPGVTLRQVHEVARSALAERGLDKWFIHGTSHSVGLDVHDPWRRDAVLRAGSVLTVEPGVYDATRNLGVRIEDMVLVTETGCEVLSAALVKRREDVERLMREDPPAGLPR